MIKKIAIQKEKNIRKNILLLQKIQDEKVYSMEKKFHNDKICRIKQMFIIIFLSNLG